MILKWNYDTSIVSVLPEGEVPYSGFDDQRNMNLKLSEVISDEVRRMHEVGSFSLGSTDKEGHTTIRREAKHFYRFVKGGDDAIGKKDAKLLKDHLRLIHLRADPRQQPKQC